MSIRAVDMAKAINSLTELGNNQQALLEVLQDYFSLPGDLESDKSDIEEVLKVVDIDTDEQCHSEGKISCSLNNYNF